MRQETLEEAATKLLWKKYPYHPPRDSGYWQDMFIEGAKWQQERMFDIMDSYTDDVMGGCTLRAKEWFETVKNK